MNRRCFESMRPIEIPRDTLKHILRGGKTDTFRLFKLVGFVDSHSDFKRQCKDNGLSIENGHLNFVKIKHNTLVSENDFIQEVLLLKKGKNQVKAVRL